jgi:uncharacterized protein YqeY
VALADRIQDDLKTAMKAGEKERVGVLRMLTAALKNERIAKRAELTDEDAIVVVGREVKRRRESAKAFRDGGAADRAAAEEAEAELLSAYMPEGISDAELDAAIDEIIAETGATSRRDMGKVMGALMSRFRGRIDGKAAQEKVAAKLA